MIAITGCTGFLGRRVVDLLVKKKKSFFGLVWDRENTSYLDSHKIKYKKGDVYDSEFLCSCLKGTDTILHLAGVTHTPHKELFEKGNVLLTKKILEAARKSGVKRIVYISSAIVTSKVLGIYGQSKLDAEKLVKKSGLDFIILRPSVLYGPGDKRNIGKLIDSVKRSSFIPVIGSGNYKLQPIYVDDVARIILASADSKVRNQTFFVAGNQPISFVDLLRKISKICHKNVKLVKIPLFLTTLLVWFYVKLVKNPKILLEQIKRIKEDKVYDIKPTLKAFLVELTDLEAVLRLTLENKDNL